MSKKRNSDTLFELITRQKAKDGGADDGAPHEGAPGEIPPTETPEEAAAHETPDVEPEVEAPSPANVAPRAEGVTARFTEVSVPFAVKVIVVTALVILAFLVGRWSVSSNESEVKPTPSGEANRPGANIEPGPGPGPVGPPDRPTMTREAGKYYVVIHATSGASDAEEQEAEQIAVFCSRRGYPANVEYWIDNFDQHFYAVWSYEPFDSKVSVEAEAFEGEARRLGAAYYRQQAVDAGRSPENITQEFDPWYVRATPELLDRS